MDEMDEDFVSYPPPQKLDSIGGVIEVRWEGSAGVRMPPCTHRNPSSLLKQQLSRDARCEAESSKIIHNREPAEFAFNPP